MRTTRLELAGLSTHIVGPSDAAATCVVLHGFGAPGDDLLGLAAALDAPVRFVVPSSSRSPVSLATPSFVSSW